MLDTNVLVAGIGWPRWPREVLLAGLRGEIRLVLSQYVLDQTRRILARRFPARQQLFEDFIAQALIEEVLGWTGEALEQLRGRNWEDMDA